MNPNSYGGTALRFGSSATVPRGGFGTAASSFARMRKKASLAPLGITRTVHLPAAGVLTNASSLNWLELLCDAATPPAGSISWN